MRVYSREADCEFATGGLVGSVLFTNHIAEVDDEVGARLVLEFPHLFSHTREAIPTSPTTTLMTVAQLNALIAASEAPADTAEPSAPVKDVLASGTPDPAVTSLGSALADAIDQAGGSN